MILPLLSDSDPFKNGNFSKFDTYNQLPSFKDLRLFGHIIVLPFLIFFLYANLDVFDS